VKALQFTPLSLHWSNVDSLILKHEYLQQSSIMKALQFIPLSLYWSNVDSLIWKHELLQLESVS